MQIQKYLFIVLMLFSLLAHSQKEKTNDFLNLFETIEPVGYHLSSMSMYTGSPIDVEKYKSIGFKKALEKAFNGLEADLSPIAIGRFDFNTQSGKKYTALIVGVSHQIARASGLIIWNKEKNNFTDKGQMLLSFSSRDRVQAGVQQTIYSKILNYIFQNDNLSDKNLEYVNMESWLTKNSNLLDIIVRKRLSQPKADSYSDLKINETAVSYAFDNEKFIDRGAFKMDVYKYPFSNSELKVFTGEIMAQNPKSSPLGYTSNTPVTSIKIKEKNNNKEITAILSKKDFGSKVFRDNTEITPTYETVQLGVQVSIEAKENINEWGIVRMDLLSDKKVENKEAPKRKTIIDNPNTTPSTTNPEKDAMLKVRGDEFLSGYEIRSGKSIAKYWKNNVATLLTNGQRNAMALSVCAVDNNVYVAGWEENNSGIKVAKYWKNGIGADLSPGIYNAIATGIFAIDNKVYVSGNTTDAHNQRRAVYWDDGELNRLSDQCDDASANSIFVSNGTAYVAGFEWKKEHSIATAKYWENGKSYSLSDGKKNTIASCVYRNGNDVIIAGQEQGATSWTSKYWKGTAPYNINIKEAAFFNSVPVNLRRNDGVVTSILYANSIANAYSTDKIKRTLDFAMDDNVKPKINETEIAKKAKVEADAEKFKRDQAIMLAYMKRKNIKPGDTHYLVGVLEEFNDLRPRFDLYYKMFDGKIKKVTISDWHGWGECRWVEETDDCIRTRTFVSADEFRQSVCKVGGVVAIKGNWGVGKFDIKLIHHLN